jgi:nitroreductase
MNTTNPTIETILSRRTIRKFKPEQITEDELNAILECGLYAPCAGGRQGVLFVVSTDKDVNLGLGRIKKAHFHGRMSDDKVYISKEQPSIADDATIVDAFYGAPTVVTLFAPKNFLYSVADCSCAAENMLLAAQSLGIGGCFIGSAWDSFDDPFGKEVLAKWGVRTDYYAVAHVLLGYPLGENAPKAKPRREDRVIFG